MSNQINVIYGKPGSGKSKIVRELLENERAYSFLYANSIIPEFCDINQITDLYAVFTGRQIEDDMISILEGKEPAKTVSCNDIILLEFCYEISQILGMTEPYKTLIFDGIPHEFDDTVITNLVSFIEYLRNIGYNVYFVTSKEKRLKLFEKHFGNTLGKILTSA